MKLNAQRLAAVLVGGIVLFYVAPAAANRNAPRVEPRATQRGLQPLRARPDAFSPIYSFQGGADGSLPYAGLITDGTGALYGTTVHGGVGSGGYGTVFKLTPNSSGYTHTVLYTFAGGGDGAYPYGGLVRDAKGDLFGTTYTGGSSGPGTVFELIPSGSGYTKKILHSFQGGTDGAVPLAGLTMGSKGALYGTTAYGGNGGSNGNNGTVFKLIRNGKQYAESVIYSFQGGDGDGYYPQAGVTLDRQGDVYGTTADGNRYNTGVVFELKPTGSTYAENIVYSFGASPDSAHPFAGVVLDKAGDIYGTATQGGSQNGGTVFKLVPASSGYTESVLYQFTGCGFSLDGDGCGPYAAVTLGKKCVVFGTTLYGGNQGIGTVFELMPQPGKLGHDCALAANYSESTLYAFQGGSDGKNPQAGLLEMSGSFYGTAFYGGSAGDGTVFSVSP